MKNASSMSFHPPPYTSQQNRVAERNNGTFIEKARTMLDEYKTSDRFWAEAVNTAYHALNCLIVHKLLKKTPYEILTINVIPDFASKMKYSLHV
jgi:hypothetical protein